MINRYLVWFLTNHFPCDYPKPVRWDLGYKIEVSALTAADALTQAPLDIEQWLLPVNNRRLGKHQSYWGNFEPTKLDRITKIEPYQPEESKSHAFQGRSDRWCEICNQPDRAAIHKVLVDVAFQQSVIADAVLAEREACAKIAHQVYEESIDNNQRCDYAFMIAAQIRARSNQPEEKKCGQVFYVYGQENEKRCTLPDGHNGCHMDTAFDPSCSTCVREAKEESEEEAKRVETMIFSADRIATLHEWQARDALTIQQLNESNQELSEKIAQLEKEKNELTQKIEIYEANHRANCIGPGYCTFRLCEHNSASRKA